MIDSVGNLLGGDVMVATTQGRGFTPEEIAERAVNRIIAVGAHTHPAIREQANAYRESIHRILVEYMNEAVRSHNVTLVSKFKAAGYPELVKILDT